MLKYLTLAVTFCMMTVTSTLIFANEHEQMMLDIMQMQRCIAENVDASYLENIAKNGDAIAKQIEQLCQAGQRQQAQDTAMDYAIKMQSDANFQAMQKCTAQMSDALPGTQALQDGFILDDLKEKHVCDEL